MIKGIKPTLPGGRPILSSGTEKKGYQPQPTAKPKPSGGYQPTTGQGAPANPPNQGSSGKK